MSQIVMLSNGERVTTTEIIAAETDNAHASVLRLVREYIADFSEFGGTVGVRFEIQPFETAGGTQRREIAYLNEDQAALLMTYMRNSEIVRAFKKRLIHAFRALADSQQAPGFAIPTTLAGALRLAADQAEQLAQHQAALTAAAPKVAFVDAYATASTGSKSFREVCKLLGAKETEFRDFLTEVGIMYRLGGKLTPRQRHIDAGRFEVKAGVSQQNNHAFNQTRFTTKGVTWIAGEWGKRLVEA